MLNFWQRWGTRGNKIYSEAAAARARGVEEGDTATTTDATPSQSSDLERNSVSENYLNDTPYVAIAYCPLCQPERDPTQEILEVRYCSGHEPSRAGSADSQVATQAYLSGSAEAGGAENAAWADALHRGLVDSRLVVPVSSSSSVGTGIPSEYYYC